MKTRLFRFTAFLFLPAFLLSLAFGQDAQPEAKKFLSPQARMAAARTVYLRNTGGTDVPFNIIQAGFESWPRYAIVDSPEKADLLVEVLAPEESSGSSVSSKTSTSKNGQPAESTTTEKQFSSISVIKLTVLDAKTKVILFNATERPKGAWKEKNRTENQIESAQKLFATFRKLVEPEATTTEAK